MRLAAVYIKEHQYLFNKKSQVLNLGGKYFYDFKSTADNEITIFRKENKKYIENFYSENIVLISGLAGANGTGKTTLLKIIHKSYQEDTPSIFVYENTLGNGLKYFIHNRIGTKDENGHLITESQPRIKFNEDISYEPFNNNSYTELYFSPILDKSIASFHSLLNIDSKKAERTLEDIFNDNFLRETVFLYSPVCENIKHIYPDFPSYDNIVLKAKKLYKRDFTKVYIDSNIGNPNKGETLKHTIDRDLRVKNFNNPEGLLKTYLEILTSDNLTDELKEIWDLPQYKNDSQPNSHLVHKSDNFIKNVEINLLSYLVLNDTYAKTELSGTFDSSKILESESFEDMLNLFLAKYILQTDRRFYRDIKEINIDDYEVLYERCKILYQQSILHPEDDKTFFRKITRDIEGIRSIRVFYDLLKSNHNLVNYDNGISCMKLDTKSPNTQKFLQEIISAYTQVKNYFSSIPISASDFIEIEADKKLSYGEKSILNLYSILYEFTLEKSHTRESENYLLILDEADLGYHPLWKRKYIDTLNKTLPQIFNTLRPRIFDSNKKEIVFSKQEEPNIQIIFTTHDPLTLSDLPNYNVVYLKKEDGYSKVLEIDDAERPTRTFGANVTDLLADSFFIDNGLIGDFAKGKIENLIQELNRLMEIRNKNQSLDVTDNVKEFWKIINIVDEPIIKSKLIEMHNDVFEITIDDEIQELEERLKYLKTLKDNRND